MSNEKAEIILLDNLESLPRALITRELLNTPLGDAYHEYERIVLSRTIPVFSMKDDIEPEVIGSGFIISGNGTHVFVSAAHVFDHAKKNFQIGLSLDRLPLTGKMFLTKTPQRGREFDPFDFGFTEISAGLADELLRERRYAIELSALREYNNLGFTSGIIGGFPASRTKFRHGPGLMQSTVLAISLDISSKEYFQSWFSDEANIFFQLGSRDYSKKKYRTIPDLWGISGGPIYGIPPIRDLGLKPQLIGMVTGGSKNKKGIVGTRLYIILRSICKMLPAFDSDIGWVENRIDDVILGKETELEGLDITLKR